MQIIGIDITSAPSAKKPLICAIGRLDGSKLSFEQLLTLTSFVEFEALLQMPGPWIAGLDCPFGLPRRFLDNVGWGGDWATVMSRISTYDKTGYRDFLNAYKADRAAGDKEHRRQTDLIHGGASPQKTGFPAVGLMLFEIMPRLYHLNTHIPGMRSGDPERICIEAYPGSLARQLIGKKPYKQTRSHQLEASLIARQDILHMLDDPSFAQHFDLTVDCPKHLVNDPHADELDAWLCTIQAARAWQWRDKNFALPDDFDPAEGWIIDPPARQESQD